MEERERWQIREKELEERVEWEKTEKEKWETQAKQQAEEMKILEEKLEQTTGMLEAALGQQLQEKERQKKDMETRGEAVRQEDNEYEANDIYGHDTESAKPCIGAYGCTGDKV